MLYKTLRHIFVGNWKIKLISLIITLMLWYFANQ